METKNILQRLPRKKKKAFKKFLSTVRSISLNPTHKTSVNDTLEDLYSYHKKRNMAKLIYSSKK